MDKIKKIRIGYIVFLLFALVVAVVIMFFGRQQEVVEEPKYEPAPPEAPRLVSLEVTGETLDFSPEVRYYEIEIPEGSPIVPEVSATTGNEEVSLDIRQAIFAQGANEAASRIYLDDGSFRNSYEVRFVKKAEKGLVLQYDDRYTFTPDYTPKEGEILTFSVAEGGWNVRVDESGVVRAVGVSSTPAVVNAYVGDKLVDSLTVTETVKAVLNIFVVAGQGNAAGEGGNTEESLKPLPGTAYTAELDDRTNEMKDLSAGRNGFTPAFAEKWYSLTTEKAFFIQTAVSDVSVTKWTSEGEAYKMAETQIKYFTERLISEESAYTVKRIFCIWLQGEWDIANNMSAEEYIGHFTDFYNGLNSLADIETTAIIPVRSSLVSGAETHYIRPVCSAQYMLSNMYEDIRIITRIPETASVENGSIKEGNLYYTQSGYNALGADAAVNLFNCYSPDTDKSVRKIEIYANEHNKPLEYGETVDVKDGETLRTVAVVTPLYADKGRVNVSYDETALTYQSGGVIGSADSEVKKGGEITFECNGVEFKFNVEFTDSGEAGGEYTVYNWTFDDLNESSNQNALVLSAYSAEESYSVSQGVLTVKDRLADFVLGKSVTLNSDIGWDIEWKGVMNDNGILLGGSFSTKGYIYLAPFARNMGYAVRMVDNDGQTFYLPYGEYAESNRQMNSWRINYTKESKTITLYANGTEIASVKTEKPFAFTFTNLFGRYGSENVNYCYTGSIDDLKIVFGY